MTVQQSILGALATTPVLEAGHVWLVGAGPGDPSQLTLAAAAALSQAEVVVYDALVDAGVLAFAPATAARIFAGKRGGKPSASQADITAQLVSLARQGRRVIRLKGGDPFVFGRGGEEVLALAAAGVPFRIVPGLTSGLAALTSAMVPATMRGVNQAIVLMTGHGADMVRPPEWVRLAGLGAPLVLYMAMKSLPLISAALITGGMPVQTPAAVMFGVSTPEEKVLMSTLENIARDASNAGLKAPAIVVIGENISVAQKIAKPYQISAAR